MKRLELEQYEINDLVRFLEYTKQKKTNDYKNKKINYERYKYEMDILNSFIDRMVNKRFSKEPNIRKNIIDI